MSGKVSSSKAWPYQSLHEKASIQALNEICSLEEKCNKSCNEISPKNLRSMDNDVRSLRVALQIGFFPESKKAFQDIKKAPSTVISHFREILKIHSLNKRKNPSLFEQFSPNLKKLEMFYKKAFAIQEKYLDRLPAPSVKTSQKKSLLKSFNLWGKDFISRLLAEIFSSKDFKTKNLEKLMNDLAFHYIRFSSEALDLSRKNLLEEKNVDFYKKNFVKITRCFSSNRLKDDSSLKKIDTFTRSFFSSEASEEKNQETATSKKPFSLKEKMGFAFFLDSVLRSKSHREPPLIRKTDMLPLLKEERLSIENCTKLTDHFLEVFLHIEPLFSEDDHKIDFYMVKKEILENLLPEIPKILPLSKSKSEKFKALDQIRKSGVKKELYPLFLEWRKKLGENIPLIMFVKAKALENLAERDGTLKSVSEYKEAAEAVMKNWEKTFSLSHSNLFNLLQRNLSFFSLLQLLYLSYQSPLDPLKVKWLIGEKARILKEISESIKNSNEGALEKYSDLLTSQRFYLDFIESFREFSVNMLSQIVPQEKPLEDLKRSYQHVFSFWEKKEKTC